MYEAPLPALERVERDGLIWFQDTELLDSLGLLVAFSTRAGGASQDPYASLDLASHSGDEPRLVDENRARLARALGLDPTALVSAEQVHGDDVFVAGTRDAGRGARTAAGPERVSAVDALVTAAPGVPLLMMYADCVPVVIVAPGTRPAVGGVHAGWKGALAALPGKVAQVVAVEAGCPTGGLNAYIGAHIGPCHYEVDQGLAAAFEQRFAGVSHSVSMAAASPRVDLGEAVSHALVSVGLHPHRIAKLGLCTAEHPALFYSYRAEGRTGRHGAIAAITP